MGQVEHLEWYQTGRGPRVLFLHGFTDSAACWEPVSRALGDSWPSMSFDARGHGMSGLPEEPYESVDMADDAALVLDQVGLSGLVVVGHSMGAATAAHLARARPDLVRALVLEDPVLHTPDEASGRTPVDERRAWVRKVQAMSLPELMAYGHDENPDWSTAELEPWAASKGQFNPRVLDLRKVDADLALHVLADTTCPTLLLRGSPSMGSLVTSRGAEAVRKVGGGRVRDIMVDRSGHSVRRDQPDHYMTELSRFLATSTG